MRRIALGLATHVNGGASSYVGPQGRYFLSVGGAGPDGAIVNAVSPELKKKTGVLAYWAEGAKQLVGYDFPEMIVHSGGQQRRASIIVIGRTVNYGGPFKITTGANLFEDSFEMLTNSTRSRWKYAACLPALWLGKLRKMEGIDAWKSTKWCANRRAGRMWSRSWMARRRGNCRCVPDCAGRAFDRHACGACGIVRRDAEALRNSRWIPLHICWLHSCWRARRSGICRGVASRCCWWRASRRILIR